MDPGLLGLVQGMGEQPTAPPLGARILQIQKEGVSTVVFADDLLVVHPVEINLSSTPSLEAHKFMDFVVKHLSEELAKEDYAQNMGKAETLSGSTALALTLSRWFIGRIGPWTSRVVEDLCSLRERVDGGEEFCDDVNGRWLQLFWCTPEAERFGRFDITESTHLPSGRGLHTNHTTLTLNLPKGLGVAT